MNNQQPPFRPSSQSPTESGASWANEPSGPGDDVLAQILVELKEMRKLMDNVTDGGSAMFVRSVE